MYLPTILAFCDNVFTNSVGIFFAEWARTGVLLGKSLPGRYPAAFLGLKVEPRVWE